jgi:hypothetical protein
MVQRTWLGALVSMLLLLPAAAQVTRVGSVNPNSKLLSLGSLTVSASPSLVNFALTPSAVVLGSSPIVVTTSWSGVSLLSELNVYAYFTSSIAALSGGSPVVNIPSSCVLGMDPSGIPTGFTAFTQSNSVGGAGAGLQLASLSSLLILGTSSHTDNLSLEINLKTMPQLPAAVYTGVLILQAQAL